MDEPDTSGQAGLLIRRGQQAQPGGLDENPSLVSAVSHSTLALTHSHIHMLSISLCCGGEGVTLIETVNPRCKDVPIQPTPTGLSISFPLPIYTQLKSILSAPPPTTSARSPVSGTLTCTPIGSWHWPQSPPERMQITAHPLLSRRSSLLRPPMSYSPSDVTRAQPTANLIQTWGTSAG